jgi:ABC-type transporter Mla MlaB component
VALVLQVRRGVTLRIGCEDDSPGGGVRLVGRLTREELPELDRVAALARRPLRIDVTHLMSADADGLAALKRLREEGAVLEGASPYLRLALGDALD